MIMIDLKMPYLVLVTIILCLHCVSTTNNTACQLYNDNGGPVNITYKSSTPTSIVSGRSVELLCEADNFCQIEWLRNGLPKDGFEHAWNFSSNNPEAYIDLRDLNQTLKFSKPECDVQSLWTCVVSGEMVSLNHTTELIVTDIPSKTSPVCPSDDRCPPNTAAKLGQELKLFCPCTAGDIATQDVSLEWFKLVNTDDVNGNETEWVPVAKLGDNGTTYTLGQPQLDMVPYCPRSDDYSTIGQWLSINKLSKSELGTYKMVATRQDDSQYKGLNATQTVVITEYKSPSSIGDATIAVASGVTIAVLLLVSLLAMLIWRRKGVDIKLMLKDRYGKTERQDGKIYDAFIAYSESDSDLNCVVKVLMPALKKAGYVPFIRDIDAIIGETLVEQLISSLEKSRRCILLISPDFIKSKHGALQLEVATNQMLQHQSKIIPLVFISVTKDQIKKLRGLDLILRALRDIGWDDGAEANNEKSLKRLLLRMPPVNNRRGSNTELPLSSRSALGGESQHSSEQCLVQPDSSEDSRANSIAKVSPDSEAGLNSHGRVPELAV